MKGKYEYTIRNLHFASDELATMFNVLGKYGWRLAHTTEKWAIFERVINSPEAPQDRSHAAHPAGRDVTPEWERAPESRDTVRRFRAVDPPQPLPDEAGVLCPNCSDIFMGMTEVRDKVIYTCPRCVYQEER